MQSDTTDHTLTEEEIRTIEAFAYLVSRQAFWSRLKFGSEDSPFTNTEIETLSEAWKKVYHCEDRHRINVAPQLEILVLATYRAGIDTPSDMIPSSATVAKCMEGYWNLCRKDLLNGSS